MKDKPIRIRIEMDGETVCERECTGLVAFFSEPYEGSGRLRSVTRAMIGALNPADMANSISSSIKDSETDEGAAFMRHVVADIIETIFAARMTGKDVTGEVSEAEAWAIREIERAEDRAEEGEA